MRVIQFDTSTNIRKLDNNVIAFSNIWKILFACLHTNSIVELASKFYSVVF